MPAATLIAKASLVSGTPLATASARRRPAAASRPRPVGVAASYGSGYGRDDGGQASYTYTNPPYWVLDAQKEQQQPESYSYGSTHQEDDHGAYGSGGHEQETSYGYGHSSSSSYYGGGHEEEHHYSQGGQYEVEEEEEGYEEQGAYSQQSSYAAAPSYSNGGGSGPANYGRGEVQNAIASNPLFTPQFMGVLQDSLARQGASALTSAPPAEPRVSATEEVLTVALQQSKQTLQQLLLWRDQIERQVAVQQKQVDRMEFALNKSRNDAAYMRALKEMMHADM